MPVTLEMAAMVDVSQAQSGFESLIDPIAKVGSTAEESSSGGVGGLLGGLGDLGGKALSLVNPIGLVANGAMGLFNAFMDTSEGAQEAQKAEAQLDAALASTGGAVGLTRDQLLSLSQDLSAANGASTFADDAILATENLLLTFTNVRGDIFTQATGMAADMAAALGGDPQSQAIALGKALNDPVAGITALTRVGVTFTAEQKDMIKGMTSARDAAGAFNAVMGELPGELPELLKGVHDSTDAYRLMEQEGVKPLTEEQKRLFESILAGNGTMEAQQVILNELGNEFGGSAAAGASTFAGKMTTLSEKFEGVKEGVMNALMPAFESIIDFVSGPAMDGIASFADQLTGMLGPAISEGASLLSGVLGEAFTFIQGLIDPLRAAVQPLIDAILNLGVGSQGTAGLMDAFRQILSNVSAFILTNVIPTIGDIAKFLAENLPAAIQFAKDAWTNVLQPAIANVWNFVSTVVFPIIGQLVQWLKDNLPPAIQTLANFWTGTLQPALAQAWSFIQTNVIPILIQVRDWLAVNLPPALQTLADFWNNTLLPAITKVWQFIQDPLLPILGTLISEGITKVKEAVGFLVTVWETIKPAFEAVTGFISDPLLPLIKRLIDDGINAAKSAAQSFAAFWNGPLKSAIDAVGTVINKIIGFINDLINKLGDVHLPDFMNPGSPTPWEIGLRGVADAMSQVSQNELPRLSRQMEALPTPDLGLGGTGNTLDRKPSLLGANGRQAGTLTIVLQDERTILRADRQSENLDLQARLETRESV